MISCWSPMYAGSGSFLLCPLDLPCCLLLCGLLPLRLFVPPSPQPQEEDEHQQEHNSDDDVAAVERQEVLEQAPGCGEERAELAAEGYGGKRCRKQDDEGSDPISQRMAVFPEQEQHEEDDQQCRNSSGDSLPLLSDKRCSIRKQEVEQGEDNKRYQSDGDRRVDQGELQSSFWRSVLCGSLLHRFLLRLLHRLFLRFFLFSRLLVGQQLLFQPAGLEPGCKFDQANQHGKRGNPDEQHQPVCSEETCYGLPQAFQRIPYPGERERLPHSDAPGDAPASLIQEQADGSALLLRQGNGKRLAGAQGEFPRNADVRSSMQRVISREEAGIGYGDGVFRERHFRQRTILPGNDGEGSRSGAGVFSLRSDLNGMPAGLACMDGESERAAHAR